MGGTRLALLTVALALLLAGCGSSDDGLLATDGRTPVIVDSDGAFDDIKAILYLLAQPDLQVVALTMSGTGVAHCPVAAENASALLERIDAPDIPVACGRQTPLAGNNAAPGMWRSGADSLNGVALPEPRPLSDRDAPDLLLDTVDAVDGQAVLVALGPLTNVAEALEKQPEFIDGISMIYLMGGAVDAGGNVPWANTTAEFNIWADPKAAAMVFATDVPITLVPLDATNYLPVTPYLYDVMAAHRDVSPTSQFVADFLDVSPLFGGMYQWDELAAVVATDESVVTLENRLLTVVEDGIDQGATIETGNGRTVRVATSADRSAFEDHFYEAMIGTSDTGIAPWEPDAVMTWDGTTCSYEGPDPLPDDFYIRLDNTGPEFVAFVSGIYDAGTTVADFEARRQAGEPGAPEWWKARTEVGAPPGAHDVWSSRGGEGITGLCYVDPFRVWEIAGPRLPE